MRAAILVIPVLALAACGRGDHLGKTPSFTPDATGPERQAMYYAANPLGTDLQPDRDPSSLWTGHRGSLFGDRRAVKPGDILTVVIEVDDEAEISNSTQRARSGSEQLGVPSLLGLPQRLDERLPEGASSAEAVGLNSNSKSAGSGSVRRNEKLTLRVAATVVEQLPNGVLLLSGTQEIRVNFEMRELLVTGYVRPEDISRQNEITYDKMAAARISYGGRGQISDMQQPRLGQQVLDAVLPF
jgi:flagellar L-ring protein precursor FlgH